MIFSSNIFSQEKGFNYNLAIAFTFSPNTEDVSAFSISPKFEFVYGFKNNWNLGVLAGLSYLKLNRCNYETESSFNLGNLIISAGKSNINLTANTIVAMKIKAGIPLAIYPGSIPKNRITEFNYNNANSSYGWEEAFVWMMNIVPLTAEFKTKIKVNDKLSLLLKTEPGFLVSINSRPSQFCFSSNLGLNTNIGVFNLSLGWVLFYSSLSLENNIHTQNSIYIGTQMDLLSKICEIDFSLNIDKPNGIIEKTAKPNWGIKFKTSL